METLDCSTYQEWLDLQVEGQLEGSEQARLEAHLEGCATCRREHQELTELGALLTASRVPVREGFHSEVMAGLPATGWEARSPRIWRLPLAVLALLVVISAAFAGMSTALLPTDGSLLGPLDAVADLFATAALTGAGLLGASWKGLGLITLEAFAETTGGLTVFAVMVVSINLLLLTLLRRRRVATEPAKPGTSHR